MRRIGWGVLCWLALAPAVRAADEPPKSGTAKTPAEQYQALVKEYDTAANDFAKAMQAVKTPEEQQKVFQTKYPNPLGFAHRFLELAEKSPEDPAALDALIWIGTNTPVGPDGEKALKILARDHVRSEKLERVLMRLPYTLNQPSEDLLRAALAKNPNRKIQGIACYNLALLLKTRADRNVPGQENAQAALQEAERRFEEVIDKYGDIRGRAGSLADAAKKELTGLRNAKKLAVGNPAPEIEGEDIDGKHFKLSEYRGKVVVLDFWGNW